MNNGLYVKGVTDGGEDDFYGIIHHIYEFDYLGLSEKIPLSIVNGLILQSMLGQNFIHNIILSK